jgi:2-polyprenyl-3-methyl-5-hydroxy-6-metoxy-1,4-benzoquinol methylase
MSSYTTVSKCRVCGTEDLRRVVSLGNQRIVDFPKTPSTDKPCVPLDLMFCGRCHLVQLGHTVNTDLLFREFWYRSGISEVMRQALQDIVINGMQRVKMKVGDIVCDVGANDGTMLSMFPEGMIKVGFDPSNQISTPEAKVRMDYAVQDYFNKQDAINITNKVGRPFKLITAIAMFYDLDDPVQFLNEVKSVLAPDGMLIIQMNYLLTMLKNVAFDNIVHEHLTYYSLTTLRWMLTKVNLEVVDVELNEVNAGSIRVYIKRMPLSRNDLIPGALERIREVLDEEKEYGLDKIETYHQFGNKIISVCNELQQYIVNLVKEKNVVYAYGASTRGTVLLQTINLPLAGVAERDENKYGHYLVAGWLKIHPEEYVRQRCKHLLILPYHFLSGILEREKEWMQQGGKLIIPLPVPRVLSLEDNELKEDLISNLLKGESYANVGPSNFTS